jgi:dipeptidyl aminopeptidase/acylaminoacyl peptidase
MEVLDLRADPIPAPFGAWKSPITADTIVGDSLGLGQVALDGADIYWNEMRPMDGGRHVVVRWRGGDYRDMLPPTYSARTRVHEYGGAAYTVADGTLYFCNDADQRMYRVDAATEPRPITPVGARRYADFTMDRSRGRLLSVQENHEGTTVVNSIVAVDALGLAPPRTLISGADFYAAPRLSPDGAALAWLSWNHPDMPWDSAELWIADIDDNGDVVNSRRLAGGSDESILQPSFSPDGTLYFVSDRDDWWNLYRWRDGRAQKVIDLEGEVGWPHWMFGDAAYAFISAHQVLMAYNRHGVWELGILDLHGDRLEKFPSPYCDIHAMTAHAGQAVFIGASVNTPPAVIQFDVRTKKMQTLRRASVAVPDPGYISAPEEIQFVSTNGETAYAFFYAPRNRDFIAPQGQRPPLLVLSHGGPTSAASPALNLKIQYWTSRGFAVLDVNYRGSVGFGRNYRRALEGRWGVVDVDDCVAGAKFLVDQDRVDDARLAIRGGSAGGYTTLCALAFHEVFRAGAVYYGVSDLEALASDTHKFEQHYLDRLIGPYPARKDLYRERSPINHVSRLACPLIFFQGLDDKVVPPDQTAKMVQALRAKRVPVACLEFAGEAHGFRRAENIKRALEAELYFYARIFEFSLTEDIDPVAIENL